MPRYVIRCKHGSVVGWDAWPTEHRHIVPTCPPHCMATTVRRDSDKASACNGRSGS